MPQTKEDHFVFHTTGTIDVYSKSGAHYQIIDGKCSCKGYGYRGTCRHIEGAKVQLEWYATYTLSTVQQVHIPTPSQLRDLHIAICTGHAPHNPIPKRNSKQL